MRTLVAALASSFFLVTIPACDAIPGVAEFRESTAKAKADLAVEIERLEAEARERPADDPAHETLSAARDRQAALEIAVQQLDHLLAESQGTDSGGVLRGVGSLTPLLPEPFRIPAVLAAGLGLSIFRARQLKRSAASIATGLQQAMDRDEALKDAVDQHKDLFRAVQTATARRIVDETTRRDRPMVRLPI